MPQKRILLVDDSTTVLLLHRMLLEERGYALVTARNGEEALWCAYATPPDLVFMDVVMPRMTGLEVCRELRSQERTRQVPIILVTARGKPQDVRAGFESGCTDYITKPFAGVELQQKLQRYLPG
jgi:CheY-like chemotaxis protein